MHDKTDAPAVDARIMSEDESQTFAAALRRCPDNVRYSASRAPERTGRFG